VFGTNALAYSVPPATQPALSLDQASSVAAYMNIKQAVVRGARIPEHWALDADGAATTDPAERIRVPASVLDALRRRRQ
jgi:LDH2 family malate/lactate/ureidoglycolate dehydrogenase